MTDEHRRSRVDDQLDDMLTGRDAPTPQRERPPADTPTEPEPAAGKRTTVQTSRGPVRASDTSFLPASGLVRRTVYVRPETWAAVKEIVRRRQLAGNVNASASDLVREALERLVDDIGDGS